MAMTKAQTKAREELYHALVGTKVGKLTILEYYRGYIGDHSYRLFRCRCDCGSEGEYKASTVYHKHVTRCVNCSPTRPAKTICFSCAKSTNKNLCSWAGLKPRTDWKAEKIFMNDNGRPTETWCVLECPEFEEGRRPLYDIKA